MKPATLRSIRDVTLLTLTGILLLFAQSAYWLNHTIFDKQNFTSIVNPILASNEAHTAIATTIVNQAFADRPIINRLIGNNVTALVSGLLGTDIAGQIMTSLVDRSYTYLTTDNPKPIQIDLVAIKTPLEKITSILGTNQVDLSAIPDTITLFNPSGLPDIYGYSILLLWLGPLFWIGFVILAVLYVYLGRKQYANRVYWLGGTILLASGFGLLVGPLLPPPIVAQVPIPELRGIVDELIAAILAPFTGQMVTVICITLVVLIIFYFRIAILHGAQWAIRKTTESLAPPPTDKKPAKKATK